MRTSPSPWACSGDKYQHGLRRNTAATPFAPSPRRIDLVNRLLPSRNLARKPKPAVRADVNRSRKPACLLQSIQRSARDRDALQNLLFVQHPSRLGLIRCHIFGFGFLSPHYDHRELLTTAEHHPSVACSALVGLSTPVAYSGGHR